MFNSDYYDRNCLCTFLSAVLFESYVINFSVDAIVGSIALVLLVRNEILKTRLS